MLSVSDWKLPELPDLSAFDEVIIDLETDGLRWWAGDRMIGAGVRTPDGRRCYLPIRHEVGPNIPPERFFTWCRQELKHKRVLNIRTKFDVHMFRADGIDLEAQGCAFGDVAHYAALLDDHRRLFNQEDLVRDFLGEEAGKVKAAHGYALDPTKFKTYPAGLVAYRAEHDVEMVHQLREVMWPRLTAEDLHRVREVEDAIIPVVVEMEHNGAPIDVELCDRWVKEATADLEQALYDIYKLTGCKLATPDKRDDLLKLFQAIRVEPPRDEGGITFQDALLKDMEPLHEVIPRLRAAKQLRSLLSKFLLKIQRSVHRDGILRYELHQLPYQDDEEGYGGAVSGRFSSAAPNRDEGVNIQQVFGVKTQEKTKHYTKKYVVRKLFKAAPGAHWLYTDASQLQFRLFAHYANSPSVVKAYNEDPFADYHELVSDLIIKFAHKELTRVHTKNVNFAQVFGAGVPKMAHQLGVPPEQIPSQEEWGAAVREKRTHEVGGPKFQEAIMISETYHEMFPEVKPLLALASHLAMPDHRKDDPRPGFGRGSCGKACRDFYRQGYRHRGYVMTYLGRRARFEPYGRFYSALNRVIQGTEGDVVKRIIIEFHKERHTLGLTPRFTVHDSLASDLQDPGRLPQVLELLNTQYYDFRVPLLWEAGVGDSWAAAEADSDRRKEEAKARRAAERAAA